MPSHSREKKAIFLEMLGDAFPADSLDNNTGFIESLPDLPLFKRQEHYLSFKNDFDNDDELANDTDAKLVCLYLQHDSLIKEITSTPLSIPRTPSPPQITPNK